MKGERGDGHVNGVWREQAIILNTDPDNSLSRDINFGNNHDVGNLCSAPESDVLFYSDEIWHMTGWNVLTSFLINKFGAIKTDWISEEDASIFDSLTV